MHFCHSHSRVLSVNLFRVERRILCSRAFAEINWINIPRYCLSNIRHILDISLSVFLSLSICLSLTSHSPILALAVVHRDSKGHDSGKEQLKRYPKPIWFRLSSSSYFVYYSVHWNEEDKRDDGKERERQTKAHNNTKLKHSPLSFLLLSLSTLCVWIVLLHVLAMFSVSRSVSQPTRQSAYFHNRSTTSSSSNMENVLSGSLYSVPPRAADWLQINRMKSGGAVLIKGCLVVVLLFLQWYGSVPTQFYSMSRSLGFVVGSFAGWLAG